MIRKMRIQSKTTASSTHLQDLVFRVRLGNLHMAIIKQLQVGWLVGWLLFSSDGGELSSPPEPPMGHIGRAKLWNYSAATLP